MSKNAKINKKWRNIALMYKVKEYIQTLMLKYLRVMDRLQLIKCFLLFVYKYELLNPQEILRISLSPSSDPFKRRIFILNMNIKDKHISQTS